MLEFFADTFTGGLFNVEEDGDFKLEHRPARAVFSG